MPNHTALLAGALLIAGLGTAVAQQKPYAGMTLTVAS